MSLASKKYLVVALGAISIFSGRRLVADLTTFPVSLEARQDACTQYFVRDARNPGFYYFTSVNKECGSFHISMNTGSAVANALAAKTGLFNFPETKIAQSMERFVAQGTALCVTIDRSDKDTGPVYKSYQVNYVGTKPNCDEAKEVPPSYVSTISELNKQGTGVLDSTPPGTNDNRQGTVTNLNNILAEAQDTFKDNGVTADVDQFLPQIDNAQAEISISGSQISVTNQGARFITGGDLHIGLMNLFGSNS